MVIQRLSIHAVRGKLKVIPVWQCLTRNGAKVCRWNVSVDSKTGVESMTVDIAVSGPQCAADVIAMLGDAAQGMTVTPLPSTWARITDPLHENAPGVDDPHPNDPASPTLTVVEGVARDIVPPMPG